jgi:hypothetical protein
LKDEGRALPAINFREGGHCLPYLPAREKNADHD